MNLRDLINNIPPVVKNLIIINILMVLTIIVFEQNGIYLRDFLGIHHWSSSFFKPHQLVTYLFMHGSYDHLFSNLITLAIFGYSLERMLGSRNFLIFYMFAGIGAGFVQLIVTEIRIQFLLPEVTPQLYQLVLSEGQSVLAMGKNYVDPVAGQLNYLINASTVGASGAVYGILLGFGMLFGERVLFPIPIKAKYFVMIYGVMELYGAIANDPSDNVAHFAHLGGMLFAFILLKVWKVKPNQF